MGKAPKAAAMFRVDGKFYVKATGSKDNPMVHGFDNLQAGISYFEEGYHRAHGMSPGFSAGAVLYQIALQPRVFSFNSVKDLAGILGSTVHPVSLTGMGVFEMAFEAKNVKRAKALYKAAKEPSLIAE